MDPSSHTQLNIQIQCLKQHALTSLTQRPNESIQSLYQSTKELIRELEGHFQRCRRYNEAKIHRKYQIRIADLEAEVRTLRQKVRLEQEARPSHSKYVSDLIDKMVKMREDNAAAQTEIAAFRQKINKIDRTTSERMLPQSINPEESKGTRWELKQITEAIEEFLRSKEEERKISQNLELSHLERFLKFNRNRHDKWNLGELLLKLDKWTANMKDTKLMSNTRQRRNFPNNSMSATNKIIHLSPNQETKTDHLSLLTVLRKTNNRIRLNKTTRKESQPIY